MYNKIKKYIDTDRVINEDNDYLLKEEYDSLLAIKNSYSDVCEMLEVYNKYGKPNFEKLLSGEKGEYIALKGINIVKPREYNAHNNNGITFIVDIRTKNKEYLQQYYRHYTLRSDVHHYEKGFNHKFIKYYYDLLYRIAEKESIHIGNYIYDDYVKFIFKQEFMDKIAIIENDISDINELIEYYKDRVIVVEQDQRIIDELKELDDFFENL